MVFRVPGVGLFAKQSNRIALQSDPSLAVLGKNRRHQQLDLPLPREEGKHHWQESGVSSLHRITYRPGTNPRPSNSPLPREERGNTIKGFKDFDLKAKARIWP